MKRTKAYKGEMIMSIFDINRDGKVDFTDHFLTYGILKTIDTCIADKKRKIRNNSWRDDCDPDYESDIDPDDFDSQEEYITRFSALTISNIIRRSNAHKEHHQMVDLLEARDLEGLKVLMHHHLEESKETCLQAVAEKRF